MKFKNYHKISKDFLLLAITISTLNGCSVTGFKKLPGETPPPNQPQAITISAKETIAKYLDVATVVKVPHDELYGDDHFFRAIPLRSLIAELVSNPRSEIVFECEDGYSAVLNSTMSLDAGGFLAVCNMPSSNSTFSKVIKGGVVIDPSPLYLVWTNTLAREMPWPYKISKIKVYTSGGVLAAAAPLSSNTAVTNGFNIFCRHCATCHSIRGSGGKLGIDLGAPLNVTAYWRTDVLRQLIRNPASVRDNAKMPAFPNLNQNDIDAIIKYLKFMKKNSPSSKPVLN